MPELTDLNDVVDSFVGGLATLLGRRIELVHEKAPDSLPVLVDPRERDPARRYKMLHYDWGAYNQRGQETNGLHLAFSPDGIHWTKHPDGPIIRTSYSARGGFAWPSAQVAERVNVRPRPLPAAQAAANFQPFLKLTPC